MRTYSYAPHWWEWEARVITPRATRPGLGRLIWKFGWGLIFVCAMTLFSQFGPQIGFSKFVGEAGPVISHSFTHAVK